MRVPTLKGAHAEMRRLALEGTQQRDDGVRPVVHQLCGIVEYTLVAPLARTGAKEQQCHQQQGQSSHIGKKIELWHTKGKETQIIASLQTWHRHSASETSLAGWQGVAVVATNLIKKRESCKQKSTLFYNHLAFSALIQCFNCNHSAIIVFNTNSHEFIENFNNMG